MDINLKGKSALVCGSTQGIGKAIAEELANLGCSITLCARNEMKLNEVKNSLFHTSTQKHQIIVADFSKPNDLEKALEEHFNAGNEYQILINNTGGPPAGKAIESQADSFRIAFNQHLICNQLLTKACLKGMKEARYGRIVNIISTSVKAPIPNLGVSNTIRGAVASWSKTLANELGPFGITVNNILPGATATQRLQSLIENNANQSGKSIAEEEQIMKESIPARRFALPEEVAAAAAFLVSPAAAYVNGINLPVDGGRLSSL